MRRSLSSYSIKIQKTFEASGIEYESGQNYILAAQNYIALPEQDASLRITDFRFVTRHALRSTRVFS